MSVLPRLSMNTPNEDEMSILVASEALSPSDIPTGGISANEKSNTGGIHR